MEHDRGSPGTPGPPIHSAPSLSSRSSPLTVSRLAVLPQYLLPKQALTAFAGKVASAQAGALDDRDHPPVRRATTAST